MIPKKPPVAKRGDLRVVLSGPPAAREHWAIVATHGQRTADSPLGTAPTGDEWPTWQSFLLPDFSTLSNLTGSLFSRNTRDWVRSTYRQFLSSPEVTGDAWDTLAPQELSGQRPTCCGSCGAFYWFLTGTNPKWKLPYRAALKPICRSVTHRFSPVSAWRGGIFSRVDRVGVGGDYLGAFVEQRRH